MNNSLRSLHLIEKASAGLLTGNSQRDHIAPLLASFQWLPIKSRIEFKILLLTFMLLRDQGLFYLEKHQIIPIDPSALGLLVYVSFSGHSDGGLAFCQGTGGLNIYDQTENLHL